MSWNPESERLRLKGILKGKPLIGPRAVNIHLTNVCDRRCNFCWYFSPLVSWCEKRKEMDFEVLKNVLGDCRDMGVEEINLEGGEVVLYPRIKEVFTLVHQYKMVLAAYTHLAYGVEPLEYLRYADRLNVNLSAASAASYQHIHGADRFLQVTHNLKLLSAMKTKFGKPAVVLSFIITEQNFHEIDAFLKLAEDANVSRVSFRMFEATVEMKSLVFSAEAVTSLRYIVAQALVRKYKVNHNLSWIHEVISREGFMKGITSMVPTKHNNDRLFYFHAVPQDKVTCYTGWFNALINEAGQVIAPCDNIGVCIAGNVNTESFKDIWFNSGKFKDIRREAMCSIDITKDRWRECRYCGHVPLNQSVDKIVRRLRPGGAHAD